MIKFKKFLLTEKKKYFSEDDYKEAIADMEKRPNDREPGGIGDWSKPSEFDAKELRMGAEVEFEHTNDIFLAIQIAMDHLKEIKDYYTRLVKMEKEAKG